MTTKIDKQFYIDSKNLEAAQPYQAPQTTTPTFSRDLLNCLFKNLHFKDLAAAVQVCHSWQVVAIDHMHQRMVGRLRGIMKLLPLREASYEIIEADLHRIPRSWQEVQQHSKDRLLKILELYEKDNNHMNPALEIVAVEFAKLGLHNQATQAAIRMTPEPNRYDLLHRYEPLRLVAIELTKIGMKKQALLVPFTFERCFFEEHQFKCSTLAAIALELLKLDRIDDFTEVFAMIPHDYLRRPMDFNAIALQLLRNGRHEEAIAVAQKIDGRLGSDQLKNETLQCIAIDLAKNKFANRSIEVANMIPVRKDEHTETLRCVALILLSLGLTDASIEAAKLMNEYGNGIFMDIVRQLIKKREIEPVVAIAKILGKSDPFFVAGNILTISIELAKLGRREVIEVVRLLNFRRLENDAQQRLLYSIIVTELLKQGQKEIALEIAGLLPNMSWPM